MKTQHFKRKIHIDNQIYTWACFKGGRICISNPQGTVIYDSRGSKIGWPKVQWQYPTAPGPVDPYGEYLATTPAAVKKFIVERLLSSTQD